MDESTIRRRAQAHGDATVAGDLKRAGSDLSKGAMAQAPEVMGKMPKQLTGAHIQSVRPEGQEWIAVIRYEGGPDELQVESRWAESDGTPVITNLRIV
jgi:hypothetical protein